MEALKIGTAVVGIWLAGYGAGAWYGGRQADQRWTAAGIRSHVYEHHQGNAAANELSIACDDIEYVYRVGATAVRERPTRGTTAVATLLPKLTRNEAFTGATLLTGLTKVQDLSAVVEPISNKAHWTVVVAGAALGFYVGYEHHREETPACDRKLTQVVLKDVDYWQQLVELRERIDARPLRPIQRVSLGVGVGAAKLPISSLPPSAVLGGGVVPAKSP